MAALARGIGGSAPQTAAVTRLAKFSPSQYKRLSTLREMYCEHRLLTGLSTDFGDNFFEHRSAPCTHRPEPDALLDSSALLIRAHSLLPLGFGCVPLNSIKRALQHDWQILSEFAFDVRERSGTREVRSAISRL
jgi:hypothetical protein